MLQLPERLCNSLSFHRLGVLLRTLAPFLVRLGHPLLGLGGFAVACISARQQQQGRGKAAGLRGSKLEVELAETSLTSCAAPSSAVTSTATNAATVSKDARTMVLSGVAVAALVVRSSSGTCASPPPTGAKPPAEPLLNSAGQKVAPPPPD